MQPSAGQPAQRGQALVIFALMLPVLIGMLALVADLGYGFVERRALQNAADLAAVAAAGYLGTNGAPTDAQVAAIVSDLVAANATLPGGVTWTAYYVKSDQSITTAQVGAGTIPSSAAGVTVTPVVTSNTFYARVLGATRIGVSATGEAITGANPQEGGASWSSSPSIVALDAGGHHTIFTGSNGTFKVTGNIIDDGCKNGFNPPPTCSDTQSTGIDVVDAKQSSNIDITGQLISVTSGPLDGGFTNIYGTYAQDPNNNETITYGGGMVTSQPYYPDPTAPLRDVQYQDAACPGQSSPTQYMASSYAGLLSPGVFTSTVTINNGSLSDCGNGAPGIYVFTQGVIFTGSLTGSNVMLYSQGAITPSCANANVRASGGGSKLKVFGFIFTSGAGVALAAPSSGTFAQVAIYQSRNVPGNIGFDICPGDSQAVTIVGEVYAHNVADTPNSGAAGSQGSSLLSGCDDKGGKPRVPSGGTLTITGAAVVDVFNTSGTENANIIFDPTHVPVFGGQLVQ